MNGWQIITTVFGSSAIVTSLATWVFARVIWRSNRRTKAELRRVYAHRLVVTDGGPPDRDTSVAWLEVWQMMAVAKWSGSDRPLAVVDGMALWFVPPAGEVTAPAALPYHPPAPRGAPPAD